MLHSAIAVLAWQNEAVRNNCEAGRLAGRNIGHNLLMAAMGATSWDGRGVDEYWQNYWHTWIVC